VASRRKRYSGEAFHGLVSLIEFFRTNAHVVTYATEVKFQGRHGGDRFDARVATIGPSIDLATLSVEDDTFFEKRPPISRAAKRPGPNSAVALLGFPIGGNNLAVTRGVVSRIDYAAFWGFTEPSVSRCTLNRSSGLAQPGRFS